MYARRTRVSTVVALTAGICAAAAGQDLTVERHVLANGLTVLTHEDHSIPMISLHVFYRVGSRNESPGITGLSHLFEHMMFNGSGKFAPKQFDLLLETAGSFADALTEEDFTAYEETFSSEALETVLELEADRMRSLRLTPENLEQERGIVKEERRQYVDDVPAEQMREELMAAAFIAHPYQWPVLGWMGDLDAIRLDQAQRHFERFYGPNNATLVLAGAFSTRQTLRRIEAHFGALPAHGDAEPVVSREPEQQAERRVRLIREAALPAVAIAFKAPAASDRDAPAMRVLAAVLGGGESAPLHRKLVYAGLATEVAVEFLDLAQPSLIVFYAQAQAGKTAAECEAAFDDVMRDVVARPVADEELRRAKNQLRAAHVRDLQTIDRKAHLVGEYEMRHGDYAALTRTLEEYDTVGSADVQRVAAAYFVEKHRTVVTLEPVKPTPGAAGE